ncbi:hypothetical protein C8R45DRAFT_935144 [Mycena sanguinolenta]|nr:hypothetical protein C8R45DRAFT_935144 [Mycena sanguinolenta]
MRSCNYLNTCSLVSFQRNLDLRGDMHRKTATLIFERFANHSLPVSASLVLSECGGCGEPSSNKSENRIWALDFSSSSPSSSSVKGEKGTPYIFDAYRARGHKQRSRQDPAALDGAGCRCAAAYSRESPNGSLHGNDKNVLRTVRRWIRLPSACYLFSVGFLWVPFDWQTLPMLESAIRNLGVTCPASDWDRTGNIIEKTSL